MQSLSNDRLSDYKKIVAICCSIVTLTIDINSNRNIITHFIKVQVVTWHLRSNVQCIYGKN